MANADNPEKGKTEVEAVLREFDGKHELLKDFCSTTKALIERLLGEELVRYQHVQSRVKARDKLKEKYLDAQKDYRRLDDITDQAALRVITYYEDEIDGVVEIIKREFEIDATKSIDKRETEPDKFGYYALNYVCKYSTGRISLPEYKKFASIWCEIQVTSILRHAWSEIEHPWYDLKGAYPGNIKRRFARMAALLEIAESEFLSLRKVQSDYQQSVAVQVEAKVPDLPIDAVSLRSFIEQEPMIAKIDEAVRRAIGVRNMEGALSDARLERHAKAAGLAGLRTVQQLRDALKEYETVIPEFIGRASREFWPPPEPDLPIPRGTCVFQLCVVLSSLQGAEAATGLIEAMGMHITWDMQRQVAVAREVVAQHGGR